MVSKFDADLVIGSRLIAPEYTRVYYFWHKVGNKLITLIFNLLNNTTFTDIYSCYLLFKRNNYSTIIISIFDSTKTLIVTVTTGIVIYPRIKPTYPITVPVANNTGNLQGTYSNYNTNSLALFVIFNSKITMELCKGVLISAADISINDFD
jgi:hypothetical protein